jgi:hypothetical protein
VKQQVLEQRIKELEDIKLASDWKQVWITFAFAVVIGGLIGGQRGAMFAGMGAVIGSVRYGK